jgi:hypothetical protein
LRQEGYATEDSMMVAGGKRAVVAGEIVAKGEAA